MTMETFLTSSILNNMLFLQIIILVLGILLINHAQSLRQQFFAWIFSKKIHKVYTDGVAKFKKELFVPMHNFRSLDKSVRNQGLIRVLEIGVGPGANFEFYPKNARLVLVDPNPHFEKYMQENQAKNPQVIVEKFILGDGEDLQDIHSDSVDIVVTTAVLCSVHSVEQTLAEIHRVLAPGGKYFFMEHVIGAEGSGQRLAQKLAHYFWKFAFCGCQITRNTEKFIKQFGFAETELKYFNADLPWYLKWFVGRHIYGNCTKKI